MSTETKIEQTAATPMEGATGVFPGVPFREYQAWPGVNQSTLKQGVRSMAHVKAALDEAADEGETSDAMALGQKVHTFVLEPSVADEEFVLWPEVDDLKGCAQAFADYREKNAEKSEDWIAMNFRKTKAYKDALAEWNKVNVGKTIVSEAEARDLHAIQCAVETHFAASALLDAATHREVCIQWRDGDTGVLCKARLDIVAPNVVADLKTAQDASPEGFRRAVARYGYHLQLAWYVRGWMHVTGLVCNAQIVAVESSAPYGVAVYQIKLEDLAAAHETNMALLANYADCVAADVWPSYDETVQEIDVPPWAA